MRDADPHAPVKEAGKVAWDCEGAAGGRAGRQAKWPMTSEGWLAGPRSSRAADSPEARPSGAAKELRRSLAVAAVRVYLG